MTGRLTADLTGDDYIELGPPRATADQLALTNRLELVRVEHDVFDVVGHLKRIDPGLELMFDKKQRIFILYWKGMRADEHGVFGVHEDLVGAYTELDQRLIRLIERIDAQGRGRHDLQTELERLEKWKDAQQEREEREKMGPIFEELRFALRNDLGANGSSVQMHGSRGARKMRNEQRRRRRRKR